MKVIWLPQARKEVRRIGNYIRRQFGQLSYEKFKQEIREISHLLGTNPNIGIVEPLLAERTVKYHSLVMNELNKIIYFIKDDHIEVADFWDVRREPSKLAARVKLPYIIYKRNHPSAASSSSRTPLTRILMRNR